MAHRAIAQCRPIDSLDFLHPLVRPLIGMSIISFSHSLLHTLARLSMLSNHVVMDKQAAYTIAGKLQQ